MLEDWVSNAMWLLRLFMFCWNISQSPKISPRNQGQKLKKCSLPCAEKVWENSWDFHFLSLSWSCLVTSLTPEKKIHKQRLRVWWTESRFTVCSEDPCVTVGRGPEHSSREVGETQGPWSLMKDRVLQPQGTQKPALDAWSWGVPVTSTPPLLLCLLLLCPPCQLPALSSSWGASCNV
jgi:hypothetical protein